MAKRTETIVKNKLDKIHRNMQLINNGGEITKGYKPDRVYVKNKVTVVVEIETSTDRKKHIGNYIKAHHYLVSNNKAGYILLIIKERDNTKLINIAAQIEIYKNWIESSGIKPIPVQIIAITHVNSAVTRNIGLLTKAFKKIGKKL